MLKTVSFVNNSSLRGEANHYHPPMVDYPNVPCTDAMALNKSLTSPEILLVPRVQVSTVVLH